jgi:hypothetical protein
MLKAQTIRFTLSCLQEGVRRARREAAAKRIDAQHAANLAASWRD